MTYFFMLLLALSFLTGMLSLHTGQLQNLKYLIAFFSISALSHQDCPTVSYSHAAQRNAVLEQFAVCIA